MGRIDDGQKLDKVFGFTANGVPVLGSAFFWAKAVVLSA